MSAYWYLTRGTGVVALVLLTITVALGVANVRRLRTERVPRFVVDAVHRNVSLMAVAFLAIHILTSLLDGYAPIRLVDVVIPFTSAYRPLWLGLGALSLDMLAAVMITSLLRRRIGYRAWRGIHWLAYASWPVALLHSLGTGSDVKQGWMLLLVAVCVIVVIVALIARVTAGWPAHQGRRLAALIAAAAVPLGLLVWLPSGPLAAGWARKAGTPASLLRASTTTNATNATSATSPMTSFTTNASGTVSQGQSANGLATVDISLSLSGQRLNALTIHLEGQPLDGGGIELSSSSVTLGPQSNRSEYTGTVSALNGTDIQARLHDAGGRQLTVAGRLEINSGAGAASGTVSVSS